MYDARIVHHSEVPTRPGNLHDWMNALVWATFPRSKRAIHERQHELVRARLDDTGQRLLPHRSSEQDSIAMLDEGGIVVATTRADERAALDATCARDDESLVRLASHGKVVGIVFGHALYEHVARDDPRPIWGKAVVVEVETLAAPLSEIDDRLAMHIEDRSSFVARDSGSAPLTASVLAVRS